MRFLKRNKNSESAKTPSSKGDSKPKGVLKISTVGLPDETGKVTYYSSDGDQYETPNVGFKENGDIVTW